MKDYNNENKKKKEKGNNTSNKESFGQQQKRLYKEKQSGITSPLSDNKSNSENITSKKLNNSPINLFNGIALAYYMISQFQFIDPFNQRNVTRNELIHLDKYLNKYSSSRSIDNKLNVVEAYDINYVILSTVSYIDKKIAEDKAIILQQDATKLLNELLSTNTLVKNEDLKINDSTTTKNDNVNDKNNNNNNFRKYKHDFSLSKNQRKQVQRLVQTINVDDSIDDLFDDSHGHYGDY